MDFQEVVLMTSYHGPRLVNKGGFEFFFLSFKHSHCYIFFIFQKSKTGNPLDTKYP